MNETATQSVGEADFPKLAATFFPIAMSKRNELIEGRLVHYTNSIAGISMLRNREVWMRKPQWMNDYTEVEHGFECIARMYKEGTGGKKFKEALEVLSPGIVERVVSHFDSWLPTYRRNTFVTCVSQHDPEEDATGRMGMWTAHGSQNGVAIVLKPEPFTSLSDVLGAYSFPVSYRSADQVDAHFGEIAENIIASQAQLKHLPTVNLEHLLHELFRFEMLCTKRHAFKDEREWRIVYAPDRFPTDRKPPITKHVEFINGAPQPVCKIPLETLPGYDISIQAILDRIIVGPTEFPTAVVESFVIELERAGVADAASKVFYADVPLRTR